jgi:hypothetical protein
MSGGEWQSGDQNAEEEGSEEALWGCGKLCNVCLISDSEKKLPRPPESLTFGAVSIALNKETLEVGGLHFMEYINVG